MRPMCRRLAANFEKLFCATFSRSKNAKFLEKLAVRLARSEWARLLDMIEGAARKQSAAQQQQPPAAQAAGGAEDGAGSARRRAWAAIVAEAAQLREGAPRHRLQRNSLHLRSACRARTYCYRDREWI